MASRVVKSVLDQGSRRVWSPVSRAVRAMSSGTGSGASPSHTYETLRVSQPRQSVIHVELHRPEKRNAMNQAFWREMVVCVDCVLIMSFREMVPARGTESPPGLPLRVCLSADLMNTEL
ncbi:delta(3,5)-Delta(2,4)-dienoyl-CoA isomerase, mitochondrial-like [Polyodon spathula]|uniref:delta(3,5)-Delta(2,4)-dienoyl-CoA isomerase, mitochondrial-like n=1 Tax=Polyodon spathula TaxID=7913 RepID=UPI001B7E5198|nr:delta(3,5)-Delta(2,4)-dienoyl-CoA isomerase, mitochondrial-like [Polyodon spathula]